ncbi:MAG: hypothetical protein JWR85_3556 [Marmoricola sp.]|nr:hypothetical protein [Marmoricola sp.]
MSDMDAVTAAKSDQFNADDLIGSEMTVTVAEVIIRAGTEQPVTVKLVGQNKVFRPCKTVARIMKAAWGPDSSVYPGRSMVLYTDPEVTWGGMKVGGIRVRAVSHIAEPLVIALQEKKGSKKITTVRPLQVAAGLTVEEARASIESAETLEDLKTVWSRKSMAPFRADLQVDLDARKSALFEGGPSEEDRGDAHDGNQDHPARPAADRIINQFRTAKTLAVLETIVATTQNDRDALPDAMAVEVTEALAEARASFA